MYVHNDVQDQVTEIEIEQGLQELSALLLRDMNRSSRTAASQYARQVAQRMVQLKLWRGSEPEALP